MSRVEHYGAGRREVPVGVPRLVADVAERGWVNALLTGNSPLRARYKLDGAGLDVDLFDWDASFFGHEARIRSDLTRRAADALAGASVVIIGDTPADGVAAEAAGFPSWPSPPARTTSDSSGRRMPTRPWWWRTSKRVTTRSWPISTVSPSADPTPRGRGSGGRDRRVQGLEVPAHEDALHDAEDGAREPHRP